MSKEFTQFFEKARNQIEFIQGVPAEVSLGAEEGALRVYSSGLDDKKTQAYEFDRIVLATGLSPTVLHRPLADTFGLTLDEYGYLDPDTEGAGLFFAGACAGPSDIQGSRLQALAAAGRAMVWMESLDRSAPRVDLSQDGAQKGVSSHAN